MQDCIEYSSAGQESGTSRLRGRAERSFAQQVYVFISIEVKCRRCGSNPRVHMQSADKRVALVVLRAYLYPGPFRFGQQ